jgi:hypothetical protein
MNPAHIMGGFPAGNAVKTPKTAFLKKRLPLI